MLIHQIPLSTVVIDVIALIDGLQHNLLSVIQFNDKGFKVDFNILDCNIYQKKDGSLSLRGVRKGSLFVANLDSTKKDKTYCFYGKATVGDSMMWHRKLSHLNLKTMNLLMKKELVRGLPQQEFCQKGLCEDCQMGKLKRVVHKSKNVNTNMEPLKLIHMDLFGPVNVPSLAGKRYALVLVDDYSRYTWVRFLETKDEATQEIIDLVRVLDRTPNDNVRFLRSDNGTEFRNSIIEGFCKDEGIVQQFSAARTPQQNGVVERKNRALIEAARTMLHDAKLPTYFWAEAINTACYTQNRSMINKTHGNTPSYILKDKKPTVKYFHVFSRKCFLMKENHEKKGKSDTKAHEGIFVGYGIERTTYRVFIVEHKIIDESVNVTFDETKFPGLHDEGHMELLIFENQGFLEN